MMNIIDFVKEFEFKKRRRLRSWGVRKYAQRGANICSGGCGRIAAPPLKPPLYVKDIEQCRLTNAHIKILL